MKKKRRPAGTLIAVLLLIMPIVLWCSYEALCAHVELSNVAREYPTHVSSTWRVSDENRRWRNTNALVASVLLLLEGGGVLLCIRWREHNRRLKTVCQHCKGIVPHGSEGACPTCGQAIV